ncbi:Alpha/Beta hydrolase protein [Thelonectria olida]|uniref:Alpha/Beta hydrolase protein n=1 Tax=Thelonectria olida TaxID=1576542 RepID=A0A9P8VWE8_9HYPO|nr:Alpha/Beta hydrolase protein [Thelonectria olida]
MIFSTLRRAAIFLALATSQVLAENPFPDTTTCDELCQQKALSGSKWISEQQSDPDFGFYKVPSKFSSHLSPGLVLTVEDATNLTNYVVPSGLTMSRLIYTTEDLNGTVLPASAYVLWPYSPLSSSSNSTKQGIPLVAWAHGTTGTFKPCAPSSYRALQYHFQVPFALALQGIAVVAPDYAGLGLSELPSGETIPHPWLTAPAHANDLAHAVAAARSAFPNLLDSEGPFVAMGHSQGGGASWAFAERQAKKPLKGYKGTVSIAPVTRILDDLAYFSDNSLQAPILFAQGAVIDSISKTYPKYNYAGLTPKSYDRWHNVLAKVEGCFPILFQVFGDLAVSDLAKPKWYNDPLVEEWAERVQAGRKPFAGPLLVLNGDEDHVVRHEGVDAAVKATCDLVEGLRAKDSVEHVTYPGMDHFSVIQASQLKWMGWIKDRLAGEKLESKACSSTVTPRLRTDSNPQSSAPNFFLSFFGPEESWKYNL